MKITLPYTDENRLTLIETQRVLGFNLIEDQRHFDGKFLVFDDSKPPPPPIPPASTHLATLISVSATTRPARVKRVWQGKDYFYDCYVSQTVRDEFIADKILIGDYVLVHFDNELKEQIVTAKVFKSW